ncbi:class I SAM-dependent methyltransferase [Halobacteriales archaeon Cl-PHB]
MDSEDGYRGDLALVYDERFADVDMADVECYVDRASAADGPVLELACGTGRVYLELLAGGVDADGIDLSADALAILRDNADDRGLDPSVWQADMTEFAADREYALVTCPFNSFQHLRTVDAQLSALERVHEALAPGGAFVFDVFVPGFDVICEAYGEWETETVDLRGDPHEYRTRSTVVDEVRQAFEVENVLFDPDGDRVASETLRLSMLPPDHVELLARLSPFADWDVRGDFTDEPLADGHEAQVWTVRKAGH